MREHTIESIILIKAKGKLKSFWTEALSELGNLAHSGTHESCMEKMIGCRIQNCDANYKNLFMQLLLHNLAGSCLAFADM